MTTKMTQKALAMLLALVMLFSLIPTAAFADEGITLAEVELPIVEITEDEEPAAEPKPAPEEIPEEPAADNIPDEPVGDDALGVPSEEEEEELLELSMDLTLSDEERFEEGEDVPYMERDESTKALKPATCTDYTEVTGDTTTWGKGWYVVKDNVTLNSVTLTGDVHLILTDGAKLTVTNGISCGSQSLTVYAQSAGTGALEARISSGGNVTINGGTVNANATGTNSYGISAGTRTINGGKVTALADGGTTYTITIPSTLTVKNSGWNATAGISATGSLESGKKLFVTARSDYHNDSHDEGESELHSKGQAVRYKLAASGDTNTTYANAEVKTFWEFTTLSETAATQTMGIVVEDYSNKPAGTYQDWVTFTAIVMGPVTWNNDDITGSGNSFTKDGVTITAGSIDFDEKNFEENGTFTTTLGNFTKIEVVATNGFCDVEGTGWSGDSEKRTWTGNASSVSFIGDIYGDGNGIKFVFTIVPTN